MMLCFRNIFPLYQVHLIGQTIKIYRTQSIDLEEDTVMPVDFTPEQEKQVQNLIQQATSNERVSVLKIMKKYFGEKAYEVYAKHVGENVRSTWKKKSEAIGDNSLEAFITYLWEPLQGQGYEYTMKKTQSGFQFSCTKCPAYERAKSSKNKDFDLTMRFYLACEMDAYMAEGWNPNIGFKRTKTLMQGDDCCNHYYYYRDKRNNSDNA